ncbi:O-antigen ligase family protein [Microbacterium sp. CJ88]|uniref:O-antigen ligase family protein n=1 Tax=Microbacterium sp. CJ88 TaxID=3445672 RepID=UPI003F655FB9
MTVHTRHPVSAPPAAPVREKTGHLALRAWCIFVLFSAVAGVAWIHAIGAIATAVLVGASAVVSVVVWLNVRPVVQWRRLPWFALAYVLWAGLSLAWSAWIATSALTWLLLVVTTLQAFFVASVLTWRELVRTIVSALKWALGLSILFELGVALFVRGPLPPLFAGIDGAAWSDGQLFGGGRLQGIWGSANLLGAIALVAIVVFALRFAARAPRRVLLGGWLVLAAYLLWRSGSATALLAAGCVLVVLATVLLMRTAARPGQRTKHYIGYAVVGFGGLTALWFVREPIFAALGRSADLAARERIWEAVLARAGERPGAGWGYANPWLPWDPALYGSFVEDGRVVTQAHSMWIDVLLQLGVVGVVLIGMTYLAFVWRSWFFAVDRPRWDLRADRPYSPLTLLPTLLATVLLVVGLSDSAPLVLWGWMFLAMLGFKIKQSPLIGVGPAEQRIAMEQGLPEGVAAAER